jgi:hypothetical protein
MDGTHQSPTVGMRQERLVDRLDKMVDAGRVTEQEAERLRRADTPGEFEDGVLDIRLRHAGTTLDAAVRGGSLTQQEADGLLGRLRDGEHSRALRGQLHSLREPAQSLARVPNADHATDNPPPDALA